MRCESGVKLPGKRLVAWTAWLVLSRWLVQWWSSEHPRPRCVSVIGQSTPAERGSGRTSAHAQTRSVPWPFDRCWLPRSPCLRSGPNITNHSNSIMGATVHTACSDVKSLRPKCLTSLTAWRRVSNWHFIDTIDSRGFHGSRTLDQQGGGCESSRG